SHPTWSAVEARPARRSLPRRRSTFLDSQTILTFVSSCTNQPRRHWVTALLFFKKSPWSPCAPWFYDQSNLTNLPSTHPLSGAFSGASPAHSNTFTLIQPPRSSTTRTRVSLGTAARTAPKGSLRRLTFSAPAIRPSLACEKKGSPAF